MDTIRLYTRGTASPAYISILEIIPEASRIRFGSHTVCSSSSIADVVHAQHMPGESPRSARQVQRVCAAPQLRQCVLHPQGPIYRNPQARRCARVACPLLQLTELHSFFVSSLRFFRHTAVFDPSE